MSSKRQKGKSLLMFPEDYCVVDIETTGLSPEDSEIIEVSAVRYRGRKKQEVFSTLVKPSARIPRMITQLTGIDNRMVENAPGIEEAIVNFRSFVGGDIIMGYNVNFDINFLYDALLRCTGEIFDNSFVDVLRFSRIALTHLSSRSQTNVAAYYGISAEGAHRAEIDCDICNACYMKLMQEESVIDSVTKKNRS